MIIFAARLQVNLHRLTPVFQVGDRCHYSGAKGAMAVTCRGKELEVLNTRINDQGEQECEVKASGWCTSYWVLSRSLKKNEIIAHFRLSLSNRLSSYSLSQGKLIYLYCATPYLSSGLSGVASSIMGGVG